MGDRTMAAHVFYHAVVAGGSMAGLLATRVLADHFEHATLIERDVLASNSEPRKGVPQGRHAHVLLLRGQDIMEAFFPGLAEELCDAGAVHVGVPELAWFHAGHWRVRSYPDLSFLAMSRPLLETTIARRVRALPNVTVQDGTRVEGFRHDQEGRITGLHTRSMSSHRPIDEIEAELVVDATGRGSATPGWLEKLQFDPPRVDHIAAPVTYATCTFRETTPLPDWRALVVTGPPARRTGSISGIEGERWLVSLSAFFDEPVPRSHEEFLAFAQSLPTPELYETIRHSQPLSDVVHYHFTGSVRHRYERLRRLPAGLIVVGDAVCSFNPAYGQGMTVSAIEAEILHHALAKAKQKGSLGPGFGRRWFRSIQPVIDVAWDGVQVEDYRFPELKDQRPYRIRPLQWYLERVHQATYRSPVVVDQFYRVLSFLAPPTSLFRPRILAEVLAGAAG
jgi:2-polyprenyl-6-methoxyphenol hydroxylase-like FAD-dependent oxidoreductase